MWLMLDEACRIDRVEFAILVRVSSQNISMRELNFISVLRCHRVFVRISQTEKLDVCMVCTREFRALDKSYLTRSSGPPSTSQAISMTPLFLVKTNGIANTFSTRDCVILLGSLGIWLTCWGM